jgi:hypothetical protein
VAATQAYAEVSALSSGGAMTIPTNREATTGRAVSSPPAGSRNEVASLEEEPALDDNGDDVYLPLREVCNLQKFLQKQKPLTKAECRCLVEQAILLFENLYVHLPLKRAMYAVDPVRRLRLLDRRLAQLSEAEPVDDLGFHREMTDIFTSVRDLHTVYLLPDPFNQAVAFLPFQIEDYYVNEDKDEESDKKKGKKKEPRYMISNVIEGLDWFVPPDDFKPGVEVTHWNGVPIARAVELAGMRNAGSNTEARRARGLARLTIRPLAKSAPPDEEWVIIRYLRGPDREPRELRIDWHVATLPEGREMPPDGASLRQAMGYGLDIETDIIRSVKKRMFAPDVLKKEQELRRHGQKPREREAPDVTSQHGPIIESSMPGIFGAKILNVGEKQYGYIRIRSFKEENSEKFLNEFIKLVEQMPSNGLIIDVRDNAGGYIQSGERLLQVLTPNPIEPERLQFINTPLSLRLCELYPDLDRWIPSIERGLETGTTFSAGFPASSPKECNDKGQRYYGPVVLVTNALCYSTTDIFAAGFQDHNIGKILGTDGNTGAGGANVVSHAVLCKMLVEKQGNPLPFKPLPGGADLRIALRRTLRVGEQNGTELEDFGVTVAPPYLHNMSRRDVLEGNPDLIAKAVGILAERLSYDLRETHIGRSDKQVTVKLQTRNIDYLEVFVDGWIRQTQPVRDQSGMIEVTLPEGSEAKFLELRGYRKDERVAARKIDLTGKIDQA